MSAWAGVHLSGCVLLLVAGWAKLREPAPTRRVLAGLVGRTRSVPSWAVRGGGLVELGLGAVALATAAPGPAMAVAACYLTFAGFVTVLLAKGVSSQGCGCFGGAAEDVPLGPLHIVVNLALASTALTVAAGGGLPVPLTERAAVTVLAVALAWVVYQVLVPLPRLMAAVRDAGS